MKNELPKKIVDIVTRNGKQPRSDEQIIEIIGFVFESYQSMTSNLQNCVQKYRLGWGGEKLDEVIVAEIERLKTPPTP